MLTKFAVTNFRGFADRIEWDLSKPSSYEFNKHSIKDGILKNGIIYGPNGSGKTNLSLAIFDIVNHIAPNVMKKLDYYVNFSNAGSAFDMVDFEYTFLLDGEVLRYNYTKGDKGILKKETLFVGEEEIFNREETLRINENYFNLETSYKASLLENENNVSIVNSLLASVPLKKDHFLIKLRNFVDGMLWIQSLGINFFLGMESKGERIDQYIIEKNLVDKFAQFLKDISDQEFHFSQSQTGDKLLMCDYKVKKIPFELIASSGTKTLRLLFFWLQQLDHASFVFIDEFDAFYHYELAEDVCKTLFAKDCQAFVTTHNTNLMTNDLLRPDCYFILDKNQIKPLHECTERELREAHNLSKIYKGHGFNI